MLKNYDAIRITKSATDAYERLTQSGESRTAVLSRLRLALRKARDLRETEPAACAEITEKGGVALLLPDLATDMGDAMVLIVVPDTAVAGDYVAVTVSPQRTFLRRGGRHVQAVDTAGAMGLRLAAARLKHGMPEVAASLGLRPDDANRLMRGELEPTVAVGFKAFDVYGVQLADWLEPVATSVGAGTGVAA